MTDAAWSVSGALNFRDVGGLPAGSGVTRSGVLFRSGNLARLDDAGRAEIFHRLFGQGRDGVGLGPDFGRERCGHGAAAGPRVNRKAAMSSAAG